MKRFTKVFVHALIAGSSVAMTATGVQAQTVVISGANPLLRASQGEQLAGWLGKGDLTLTSIFSSDDFRVNGQRVLAPLPSEIAAAVDGKGPTFTILRASSPLNASAQQIGWYNPVNGTTATGGSDGENVYDAFIFNLTANRVLRVSETPYSDDVDLVSSRGAGQGISLLERRGLVEAYGQYDYGDNPEQNVFWSPQNNLNTTQLRFGQIEVFSISVNALASAPVAAVPEPATWAMMIVGFGMVGATTRYRRRGSKVVYA